MNAVVTPLGRPVAVSVTAPAKPLVRVIVTVEVPVAPCCTVAGPVAAIVKLPTVTAVTVSATVAVLLVWPVAVLVNVTVVGPPAVAFAAAVSVMVDVDDVPGMLCGLNTAVTPVGRPVKARPTAPAKPPVLVRVTVRLLVEPCPMLIVAGAIARV